MVNLIIIFFGKFISFFSKKTNIGSGSTWPGHIALGLNPNFVRDMVEKSKIQTVVVTGTNGKTTTSKLIETVLKRNHKKIIMNSSGANLLNGVASAIITGSNLSGKLDYDYAIFEVDENAFPQLIEKIEPDFVIALNLFRDQLDRYGEIDTIAKKWKNSYEKLKKTVFILNADDPQIAFLGQSINQKKYYFGLNDKTLEHKNHEHATDSILCPRCGNKLNFDAYYFSHLGKWECAKCGLKRPKLSVDNFPYYPLPGTYVMYDVLASVLFAETVGIGKKDIETALREFKPAFGRQEQIVFNGTKIQFFLSKNPTSFNESLRTISESKAENLLIILNDRIPDGTDVSWIWDIDFEEYITANMNIVISGDRVYDLGLRLKYAEINQNYNFKIFEHLSVAIRECLKNTKGNKTLYILPTYSAMLETRKILTGKKIL